MRDQGRRTRDGWLAAVALFATVGVLAAVAPAHSHEADAPDPAAVDAQELPGFAFYRQNVEPLFVRPRGYPNNPEGEAACVMCHVWQTSLRLALQEMTDTPNGWSWTEAQSRVNYRVVAQLVNASDPPSSKLLRKPLAASAGGEGHTGGTFWGSTSDPEYQAVLDWVEMLPADQFTPAPEPELDFAFYRSCVQQVFATPRYGQIACTDCHGGGGAGFAPAPANGSSWTEAEARRGFQVIERLIVPGNPEQSRWMLKPLHPEAGGSYTHNGVRRWQSRQDPEWQMLAAWIRGERTGSNCST